MLLNSHNAVTLIWKQSEEGIYHITLQSFWVVFFLCVCQRNNHIFILFPCTLKTHEIASLAFSAFCSFSMSSALPITWDWMISGSHFCFLHAFALFTDLSQAHCSCNVSSTSASWVVFWKPFAEKPLWWTTWGPWSILFSDVSFFDSLESQHFLGRKVWPIRRHFSRVSHMSQNHHQTYSLHLTGAHSPAGWDFQQVKRSFFSPLPHKFLL